MKLKTEKIRQEIKKYNWTVEEFATKCGTTRATLYYILDKEWTSADMIQRMAEILHLDGKDLISEN